MRYSDIVVKPLKEDATAGATAASNVATVAQPFMSEPKKGKKKVTVVKRK